MKKCLICGSEAVLDGFNRLQNQALCKTCGRVYYQDYRSMRWVHCRTLDPVSLGRIVEIVERGGVPY